MIRKLKFTWACLKAETVKGNNTNVNGSLWLTGRFIATTFGAKKQ